MIIVCSNPPASSAWRIAPTRPSIMSDGAMMSQPAFACTSACLHQQLDRLVVEDDLAVHHPVVAVARIGVERDVGDEPDLRHRGLDRAAAPGRRGCRGSTPPRRPRCASRHRCWETAPAPECPPPPLPCAFATARSTLSRSTPGMVAIAVRSFCPSITKSGRIRSAGVSTVSRTSARLHAELAQPPQPAPAEKLHVVLWSSAGSWRASLPARGPPRKAARLSRPRASAATSAAMDFITSSPPAATSASSRSSRCCSASTTPRGCSASPAATSARMTQLGPAGFTYLALFAWPACLPRSASGSRRAGAPCCSSRATGVELLHVPPRQPRHPDERASASPCGSCCSRILLVFVLGLAGPPASAFTTEKGYKFSTSGHLS